MDDLRKKARIRFPNLPEKEINSRIRTLHSFLFNALHADRNKLFTEYLYWHGAKMGFSFGRKLRSGLISGDKLWTGDDLEEEDDIAYVEGMRLRALGQTPADSNLVGRTRDVLLQLWRVWGDAWTRGYWDYTWLLEESIRRRVSIKSPFVGFDEANDFSKLMFQSASFADADRSVICCDPDQAIYTWNGSAPRHVFTMPFDRYEYLPHTHRVPATVATSADDALDAVAWRADGRMMPIKTGGEIKQGSIYEALDAIRGHDALVLARTNYQVAQLETIGIKEYGLNVDRGADLRAAMDMIEGGITHVTTPVKLALLALPGRYFQDNGKQHLKRWKGSIDLAEMERYIAGEELMEAIKSRSYAFLDDEVVFHTFDKTKPEVRFMTAHASKSLEADTVVILRDQTHRVTEESEPDDETRLYYVGLTRTKNTVWECEMG